MVYENNYVNDVVTISSTTAEPLERIKKLKSTDMDGKCFITKGFPEKRCDFEDWDWERHPTANLYCGCPKCSSCY